MCLCGCGCGWVSFDGNERDWAADSEEQGAHQRIGFFSVWFFLCLGLGCWLKNCTHLCWAHYLHFYGPNPFPAYKGTREKDTQSRMKK